ncbi:hypothetical protein CDAR_539361 [Caerostris darwini]|uniref:Uncharacterized protein n=1 Tax=Caerostris darwini TaxID=1538125 RepID=A0AAV4WK59_9ARAC|nr:hypothetical protein CDAR_539361 [Caerostris darwini]
MKQLPLLNGSLITQPVCSQIKTDFFFYSPEEHLLSRSETYSSSLTPIYKTLDPLFSLDAAQKKWRLLIWASFGLKYADQGIQKAEREVPA